MSDTCSLFPQFGNPWPSTTVTLSISCHRSIQMPSPLRWLPAVPAGNSHMRKQVLVTQGATCLQSWLHCMWCAFVFHGQIQSAPSIFVKSWLELATGYYLGFCIQPLTECLLLSLAVVYMQQYNAESLHRGNLNTSRFSH